MKNRKQVFGVLGLIVNKKGEVLFTQRNEPKYKKWHKFWQIPGGGIEFGETPEEALMREMKEEVGVKVKIERLLPVAGSSVWRFTKLDLQAILLCYLCRIVKGKPNSDHWETLDLVWLNPRKLEHKKFLPLTKKFISVYLNGKISNHA